MCGGLANLSSGFQVGDQIGAEVRFHYRDAIGAVEVFTIRVLRADDRGVVLVRVDSFVDPDAHVVAFGASAEDTSVQTLQVHPVVEAFDVGGEDG